LRSLPRKTAAFAQKLWRDRPGQFFHVFGLCGRRTLKGVFAVLVLCCVAFPIGKAAAKVTEAQVMDVAKELACLCGSCPNRPLDECRCGQAGSERERISKALEAGQTKDQVIAGFAGEFGERIFVTPPARGFNLMVWVMPIFWILIGGYAVRSVLRGWSRDGGPKPSASVSTVSDADRQKLDSALNEGDA
jgi:cytochrome c-type biogenesis protein CcmH